VSAALRHCTNCHNDFPATTKYFYRRHDTGTLQSWCKRCVNIDRGIRTARRKRERGERDEWDWAVALSKHTKMAATRLKVAYNGKTLDAEMLRCLYSLQDGCCALSGIRLVKPEPIMNKGAGLSEWYDSLSPEELGKAIALIRLDDKRPWELGNVMLVAHMFVAMYKCVGDISVFKQRCGEALNMKTVIYDHAAISLRRSERRKARIDAFARKEEIPW
jgi:hypothetical protein